MKKLSVKSPENAERTAALLKLLKALSARHYQFTTITPATHALVNMRAANQLTNTLVGIFGWNRAFSPDILDEELLNLMLAAKIVDDAHTTMRSHLRVSSIKAQLYLHSSYPTENTDAVFFGPDTYRFVHAIHHYLAANNRPFARIVDICTGAGPAAIELGLYFPDSEVLGVDINGEALTLANINAQAANLKNTHFVESDLLKAIDGNFDLIVANPPYLIDGLNRAYRNGGGSLGEKLSVDIVETAMQRLNVGGVLLLYTGVVIEHEHDHFYQQILQKIDTSKFDIAYQEIDPDVFSEELLKPGYDNADRIAVVLLTVTKR